MLSLEKYRAGKRREKEKEKGVQRNAAPPEEPGSRRNGGGWNPTLQKNAPFGAILIAMQPRRRLPRKGERIICASKLWSESQFL